MSSELSCTRCGKALEAPTKGAKPVCPVCDKPKMMPLVCAKCGAGLIRVSNPGHSGHLYYCSAGCKNYRCEKCGGDMKLDTTEGNTDSYVCEHGCDGVLDVYKKPDPAPMTPKPEYSALTDILKERARQNEIWGEQNHDPFVYGAILTEEVGEFMQAALDTRFGGKDGGKSKIREEAVQVAAVALAIVECLDRGKWGWGNKG